MRIVVTGAAGVLGSRVAADLAGRHEVLGVDVIQPNDSPVELLVGDLASYEVALQAISGADVVVHCAAVHPWKKYTDEQYLDCNVKGAYQVAKACAEAQVKWLVFTSSIAAIGYPQSYEPSEMPIAENAEVRHKDTYSLTKTMAEEIMKSWHRRAGLNLWSLRPTGFMPLAENVVGSRLLAGVWTHFDDVASAHVLAANLPPDGYRSAYLMPEAPYTAEDVRRSRVGQTNEVVEQYFPGVVDWFAAHELQIQPIPGIYDATVSRQQLGWRPAKTFEAWWAEERAKE